MKKVFRIRRGSYTKNGQKHAAYSLGLPREIGELVGCDQQFTVQLTDQGILFVPAGEEPAPVIPKWVTPRGLVTPPGAHPPPPEDLPDD